MKLTYNSGNESLDYFLEHCHGVNLCYGADEVIEYLVFCDRLVYEIAEDMHIITLDANEEK